MTLKMTMIAAGALVAATAAAAPNAAEAGSRHSAQPFAHPGVIVGVHWNGRQGYRPGPRHQRYVLPPRAVRHILRSQGLKVRGPIRLKGRIYVTRAVGRDGNFYRVRVHARTGRILQVRYAGRQHWRGYRSGHGGASLYFSF